MHVPSHQQDSRQKRFKTKRFILSIAPSRKLCGNLKMIYANVISLCVIQHSQLMSKLPQPYHKLRRLDITARLMCFSGTCLIAGRLQWGWSKKHHLYLWKRQWEITTRSFTWTLLSHLLDWSEENPSVKWWAKIRCPYEAFIIPNRDYSYH